jgi:acyl-coenzyme A thioesterase PaaI-like protein
LLNLYPPFLGAGIRIKDVNRERTRFKVIMVNFWLNKNAYGSHFGGSLYSMCDPFFIFILHANLGNNYIYWDKSAKIEYIRPARGTVSAVFEIGHETINDIKKAVDDELKKTFTFNVDVKDKEDKIVAKVEKTIYIKRKNT